MGQATIFNGQKIKTLKDTLTLNGKSDIISSTVDPTSSAVDAPIGSLLINQTSGKLYRKLDAGSSVNWEEVGSGVGGINYVLNPSAEVNTTGWSTYADAAGTAPVDGSGGSPTITWTRSTTSPLRGTADFNLTKGAANVQGQGVAYDLTIASADKAKVLTVSFDYEVLSGTYADGDLTVYLIADPTGTPVVIQPAGYTVLSATVGTTMRQIATFQTQATGTSYRLCFHVASTSASAYTLAVDNVVVGPQTQLYGAPVTDWVSAKTVPALLGSTTNPTTSSSAVKYRRSGDSYEVSWYYVVSTAGSGEYRFQMPDGLLIDLTKITHPFTSTTGVGRFYDSSTGINYNLAPRVSNVNNYITMTVDGGSGGGAVGSTLPVVPASSDEIWATVILPIAGLSSSVVMSQDTDTRVVAARWTKSADQAANANTQITFDSIVLDTHSAWNSGSSYYQVPVSGWYDISVNVYANGATAGTALFAWSVDGGVNKYYFGGGALVADRAGGSNLTYFTAGQQIKIYWVGSNGVTIKAGDQNTGVTFSRRSGPATIAASETVSAVYSSNSGQTINNTATTVVYEDKDFDTHGAYNATTGIYTVPVSGKYLVAAGLYYNSSTNGVNFQAVQTGSASKTYRLGEKPPGTPTSYQLNGTVEFSCIAGDTLKIQATASAGGSGLFALTELNYLSIVKVGN